MSFRGVLYTAKSGTAAKNLRGFYGIKIKVNAISVKITDFRGKGLSNVRLIAENLTSGNSFESTTDSNGSVFMQLDSSTKITIIKNKITQIVQYNGEASPTYIIDLPFIQNN